MRGGPRRRKKGALRTVHHVRRPATPGASMAWSKKRSGTGPKKTLRASDRGARHGASVCSRAHEGCGCSGEVRLLCLMRLVLAETSHPPASGSFVSSVLVVSHGNKHWSNMIVLLFLVPAKDQGTKLHGLLQWCQNHQVLGTLHISSTLVRRSFRRG